MSQYASYGVISPCGEYTHTLRLTSKLVDLRVGYAKRFQRAKLVEPHLARLRKQDARCYILFTESYRSGDVCERCLWQIKRAKRSCSRRRAPASIANAVRCGNGKRDITRRSLENEITNVVLFLNLIYTESYRSGHNEAVLKTVWEQSHVGSNPTPSAI